ncbi:LysR family transcriptional regulator [Eikenella longinqua]|uniref:LysR family transcriptional regulator n=1 Tax=Eikenella longinqua TaxID=1795827 RepID=A0A1A9RWG6_9NEIS|nr:LysR family transcriptional regulator [Eikenella longinqua]OAM26504.1 LysR family transcriptional regulator [Eikenella longinqua]
MDKLNALKHFCSAAETLQFRETALRLSVSPQVVTRVIAELETALGEQLFTRNTRNIRLTEFGAEFLPRAQALLAESENLFAAAKTEDEMRGIVRITVPQLLQHSEILPLLLAKCADYPELYLDWRGNDSKLNAVENQIDIGIRVGIEAEDLMIVRKICDTADKIVASPAYLARHGTPKTLDELAARFPASSLINADTNRPWGWPINPDLHVFPKNIRLITDDTRNELAAALSGDVVCYTTDFLCRPHLQKGELVELFPEIPRRPWQLYVYRPQRTVTSVRVLRVFDWLTQIMREVYGNTKRAG